MAAGWMEPPQAAGEIGTDRAAAIRVRVVVRHAWQSRRHWPLEEPCVDTGTAVQAPAPRAQAGHRGRSTTH